MANLIVNGGFDIASPGTTTPGVDGDTLLPGGSTAIDGWTIIGGPAGDDQLYWFGSGFDGLTSPDADAVALTGDINKNPEFGVEQTIATTPGMTYALTFDVGTSTNFADPSGAGVSVTAGNLTTTITGIITNGTDVWTPEEVDFTATSTATTIIIQGDAPLPDGSGEYVGLDDVAVNPTTNTAPPVNLVTNGSFEQASPLTALPILPGTQAGAYEGSTLTSSSTAILGWTITGSGAVNWIPDNNETPESSPFGVYFLNLADNAELENGNLGGAPFDGVTQTIATTPGTTYQLTFDLGNNNTASNTGILPTGNGIAEPSGSGAMPGWTVIGGTATGNDGLAWLSNANSYGPTAETGSYFVSLAGYLDNSPYFGVAQTIATTAGQSYELTFYLGVDNGNVRYTGPIGVLATAGPVTQTIENVSPAGTGNQWVEETVDFTATAAASTISIQGLQGNQYIGLDNVSVVQTGTGASGTNLITNGDFAEPSINPVGVSVTAGPVTTTFNNVDPTALGNTWTPETLDFTATSTTSTIAFQADQGQSYVGLDNVAVTLATASGPVTGGAFSEDGTIDTFTVPISGTYVIDAIGATGGGLGPGYAGGAGAEVDGTFTLTAGDVIEILVGGAGTGADGGAGSGGGGSFVFDSTADTLLEAAGGGGGASAGSGGTASAGGPGGAGQAGTSGTAGGDYVNGFGVSPGGDGGTDGSGGGVGTLTTNPAGTGSGGGGGGFSGSGGNGEFGDGGASFQAGGAGGTGASLDTQHNGGFGGGGGANSDSIGAGGGGGFSGGGGGEENVGGGGGSFIAPDATGVTLTGGENADGNGSVTITLTGTLTGADVFSDQVAATSGPLTGRYLWSNAANWTNGVPVDGDSVSIAALGYDDLAALSLSSVTLSAAGAVGVTAASLDVTTVTGTSGSRFVADALDAGAPVTATVQTIAGTGGLYGAEGVGAVLVDQSAVDEGETYATQNGGFVELAAPLSDSSELGFAGGVGTFALENPGASNAVAILDLAAGDTLELPGSSVSTVSFGTNSLSVTTSAGSYSFTNVTYSGMPVGGFTAAHDSTTGLEAITLTGPDIFEENVPASSGPFTGGYLWSNAANWSNGVPADGASVALESGTDGVDDLASLSLSGLNLADNTLVDVVGGALTVATVVAGADALVIADAAAAGAPVTVTVGAIGTSDGNYRANGTGGRFIDNSATDPGNSYQAFDGGLFELAAPPSANSTLSFLNDSVGTFALENPGASNAVAIDALAAGDTLELPGASVSTISFGTNSLSVTTSAGTYAFSNVTYNASAAPTGFTAAHDSTTGLEAITFTGPDIFEENVPASSGPFTGGYLWSNAANWSNGVPADGATVATQPGTSSLYTHGIDDILGLSVATFTQAAFGITEIATNLTVQMLINSGTIQVDSPNTLTVSGAVSGTGVIVDDPSTIELNGSVSAGQTVALSGTGSVLQLGDPQQFGGKIDGFTFGDVLDLSGVQLGSIISTAFVNDVLTLNESNGSITVKFADSPDLSQGSVNLIQTESGAQMTDAGLLCFTAGTRILTPRGEIAVEALKAGDCVRTLNGADRAIKWIGSGRVLATRGRRNAATPVIVRRNALADNVPHCDLRVTKGHSLYLDGALIPVEFLVNHCSIIWDDRAQEVAICHVELETHDVLLANGAPAESYRDDGNRWLFRNANTGWSLPPQPPCAPVLTGGTIVDAVWRRLLGRAGPRPGHALTNDPDLHLLADGVRWDAVSRLGGAYIFSLPGTPARLRIVSRAGAPAELGLARDPRVLGVALRSIVVRQGSRFSILGAADARLIDGFHAHEPELDMRWTDGDAAVPWELFLDFSGPVELVLHVGVTAQYLDDGDVHRAA